MFDFLKGQKTLPVKARQTEELKIEKFQEKKDTLG